MSKTMQETIVRVYTDHCLPVRLYSTDTEDVLDFFHTVESLVEKGEPLVLESLGTSEVSAHGPMADLLRERKAEESERFVGILALERFRSCVETAYGISDLMPGIEEDTFVVEGITSRYPRIEVTVLEIGSGENEEERADRALFKVVIRRSSIESETPTMAGSSLTKEQARVLVIGLARVLFD